MIDGRYFFKNFWVECKGFWFMIFGGLFLEDRMYIDFFQVEIDNFIVF